MQSLGYFNAPTPPVGSVGGPINYWQIYCRDEFNILVSKKYKELEVWLGGATTQYSIPGSA